MGAAGSLEVGGEAELGEVAQIGIGHQLDRAAVAAVAAVGTTAGHELLAAEADAAIATAAALHEHGGVVGEHRVSVGDREGWVWLTRR